MSGPSDQLFPRAALSADQHIGFAVRDPADRIVHALHRGTHPHNSIERISLKESVAQCHVAMDQEVSLRDPADGRTQLLQIHRFGQIVVHPRFQRLNRGVLVRVRGDDDRIHLRRIRFHPGDQLHAIHSRHTQIGNDQIRRLLADLSQRALSIRSGPHLMSLLLKKIVEHLSHIRLIIHH